MSDAPLSDGWYVSREHEMLGPLSDAELRSRVHMGGVSASDYVWREGQELWVQVSDMPALKSAIRASSPAAHEQMRADTRAEHTRRDDERRQARQKFPAQPPARRPQVPKMPEWAGRLPGVGRAPDGEAKAPSPTPASGGAARGADLAEDLLRKLRGAIRNPGQLAGILFVAGILIPPLLLPLWFAAWLVWTRLRK